MHAPPAVGHHMPACVLDTLAAFSILPHANTAVSQWSAYAGPRVSIPLFRGAIRRSYGARQTSVLPIMLNA